MTEENLEEEQSTRNAVLMRLLEDLHLVENRGTGIAAMIAAMRAANLEPPRFEDRRTSFRVTFRNHSLMDPESALWLRQFTGGHVLGCPGTAFPFPSLPLFRRRAPSITNAHGFSHHSCFSLTFSPFAAYG